MDFHRPSVLERAKMKIRVGTHLIRGYDQIITIKVSSTDPWRNSESALSFCSFAVQPDVAYEHSFSSEHEKQRLKWVEILGILI
ncbi:hypothetical protein LINPERHAP1_LOCUS2155, partial [Linum perenne]